MAFWSSQDTDASAHMAPSDAKRTKTESKRETTLDTIHYGVTQNRKKTGRLRWKGNPKLGTVLLTVAGKGVPHYVVRTQGTPMNLPVLHCRLQHEQRQSQPRQREEAIERSVGGSFVLRVKGRECALEDQVPEPALCS